MKEKNLLAELAAYLFSHSDKETGRTPSERELAEHFGVSRGQIREALAILEAMRIVERRAKSGIYIDTKQASVEAMALFARAGLPLDPIQIYETVELRKIHEIKAAELACSRATEENFERLREILKASEERIAAGEGLAKEDREFHLEIVRATKNSVFHNVCSVYYDGRTAPADLFQRPRTQRALACRAHPDLRGAAAPRRQPRPALMSVICRARKATGKA